MTFADKWFALQEAYFHGGNAEQIEKAEKEMLDKIDQVLYNIPPNQEGGNAMECGECGLVESIDESTPQFRCPRCGSYEWGPIEIIDPDPNNSATPPFS